MAKKRISKVKSNEDPRMSFLTSQIDAAKKEFNSENIYAATNHGKTLYGIPFPSLALEHLFTSNVFLMSKLVGLAGQKGSLKSTLGFEILRWFIEWRGIGVLVETENKASEQYVSVLQDMAPYCQFDAVRSVQAAQDRLTFYKERHEKDKTMKSIPLALVVDSLTGSAGAKTKEDMVAAGHAVKGYSESALLWTSFLTAFSSELIGTPVCMIFTNHLKDKIGGMVRPGMPAQKTTPGGTGQGFHATYYMYMALAGMLKAVNRPGKKVNIVAEKNSMGPDKNHIMAEFLWYYKPGDPHTQISYWDWYSTTSIFLTDPKTSSAVRSVVQLQCTANRYSSSVLGFKNLSATEAGYFLENCPVYRRAVQGALNIPLRKVWHEGEIMEADKCDQKLPVNLPEGTISEELKAQLAAFNKDAKGNFMPAQVEGTSDGDPEVKLFNEEESEEEK